MKKAIIAFALVSAGTAVLVFWPSGSGTAASPGTVTYRYDSLGRIVQDTYPANSAAYSYDNSGNRASVTIN